MRKRFRPLLYEVFIDESRRYWDYVRETKKTERKPVTYISFDFEDSEAGRKVAYDVEFRPHQIPINLRYVDIKHVYDSGSIL